MKTLDIDQQVLAYLYEALFEKSEHRVALSMIFEERQIDPREGRRGAEQMQRDGLIRTSSLAHHSITGHGVLAAERARVVPDALAACCKRTRRQILELAAAAYREKGEYGRADFDVILNNVAEPEEFIDAVILLLLEMNWIHCPASRCFSITQTGLFHLQSMGS